MGHFERGGNRGGNRRGGFGGRRDGGRLQMHHTTCSSCGNDCDVPFKPTGSKPVFCSNCFDKKGDNGAPRRERRDSRRPSFGGDRDREMHKTDCAECGNVCEVPFAPRAGRPVYCDNCFSKQSKTGRGGEDVAELKQKIDALHAKVDILMNILDPEKKAVKKTPTKKSEPKTKTAKKKTTKKTPAKKTVKKAVKKTTKKAVKKTPAKKTAKKK